MVTSKSPLPRLTVPVKSTVPVEVMVRSSLEVTPTAPTMMFASPVAEFPSLLRMVSEPKVTPPRFICVPAVWMVPDKVTVLGKSAPPFPSVDNPPAKVRVSPPLPKVSVPSFKKFVSPAASKVDELITTLYASLPALLTVNPVVMSTS